MRKERREAPEPLLTKLCAVCGKEQPHRARGDDPTKPRSACIKCSAEKLKEWRQGNGWQRRKAYDTWRGVLKRCLDRRSFSYRRYGAVGITVCDGWRAQNGFENFLGVMGYPPTKEHTLDRIKAKESYTCGRCMACISRALLKRAMRRRVWSVGDHVGPYELVRRNKRSWIARCINGHERAVLPRAVESRAAQGRIRGCAQCISNAVPREPSFPLQAHNVVDMAGMKVGRLTVISRVASGNKTAKWLCRCECGNEKAVSRGSLLAATKGSRSGTYSCGCAQVGRNGKRGSLYPAGEVEKNAVWNRYERAAKDRGLSLTLTRDQFSRLIASNCFYCDSPPEREIKSTRIEDQFALRYNGIDRKDNSLGYTAGNCVSCCYTCNRAKNTMTIDEFAAWVIKLASNLSLKFKSNCRWATPEEQTNNRKDVIYVTCIDPWTQTEERRTLKEWVERAAYMGLELAPIATIRRRLKRWTKEKALFTPKTPAGVPF